ncbi:odorant receptor 49b-like isoform X2 [Cylas formicarius]|uniref:odorant receptor 49b-like isoform X2 n=1 Tax=Cylas formicarius TaxID=197179 RepID=UPI002958ADAF|nr:odorant receptor 49b-like isoform X2 [Cylas formicarius]
MAPHLEIFRFARITMIVSGIWKLELCDPFKHCSRVYPIYSVMVHVIYTSFPLLLLINFPHLVKNDPSEAMETISKILYGILSIVKLFSYQSESSQCLLAKAIQEEGHLNDHGDDFVKRIHELHVSYCNVFNKFILMSVVFGGSVLCEFADSYKFHRLPKNESVNVAKPLPLPFWYPFDENKHHVWVLVEQLLTIVWCALLFISVQIFSNSALIYMRGQLKILQKSFKEFHQNMVEGDSNSGLTALKHICVKHQNLIGYINTANRAFRTVVFFEYGISSAMLATALFQVVAGRNVTTNVIHVSVLTSQLLLLAWSSDEIVAQSLELAPALYQSNWYECDKDSRILIRIMLMRCQKPLSIDIGSFGAMTVRSAMSRLKLAYSYTSVMTK